MLALVKLKCLLCVLCDSIALQNEKNNSPIPICKKCSFRFGSQESCEGLTLTSDYILLRRVVRVLLSVFLVDRRKKWVAEV